MAEYLRPTTWISYTPNEQVKEGKPAVLTQLKAIPKNYKGEIETEWTLIEDITPLAYYAVINASPITPIKPVSYIDLDIRKAFHIPLPTTLKFARFTNSNATAKWDKTDEIKLKNVSSSRAIASGLKSKIVLIGDITDTFEYFGVSSPGPFVFRNSNRAIEIININGVFKVTDMLLQLIETPSTSVLSVADTVAPRVVLLDRPSVETKNGLLSVQIRTVILEEPGVSETKSNSVLGWLGSPKDVYTTDKTFKVQVRFP